MPRMTFASVILSPVEHVEIDMSLLKLPILCSREPCMNLVCCNTYTNNSQLCQARCKYSMLQCHSCPKSKVRQFPLAGPADRHGLVLDNWQRHDAPRSFGTIEQWQRYQEHTPLLYSRSSVRSEIACPQAKARNSGLRQVRNMSASNQH